MSDDKIDELNRLVDAIPEYRDRVNISEKKIRDIINSDYQAGIVALTNVVEDIATKSKITVN
ncbi:hypothetical protein [Proteus hauseri]|uniref:hypothetical protein n=1 Tax=Proteus hauseri TaxID=183417 RepID=UPI00100980B6|nr:hypothetical protein [Proteus hauseri]QAV24363.1 hypothetical protein PH4a_13860 [Proteus hauseri]